MFFIKVYGNREIVMSGLQNRKSGQIRRKVRQAKPLKIRRDSLYTPTGESIERGIDSQCKENKTLKYKNYEKLWN